MTYDLCHGGHMVAEYPLLHTPKTRRPTSPIGSADSLAFWDFADSFCRLPNSWNFYHQLTWHL